MRESKYEFDIEIKDYDELIAFLLSTDTMRSTFLHIATVTANIFLLRNLIERLGTRKRYCLLIRGELIADKQKKVESLMKYLELKEMGVEIKVRPQQHKKFIITDSYAIFGSANFTYTALHNLQKDENLYLVKRYDENGNQKNAYSRIYNSFMSSWNEATPLEKYIVMLKKKVRMDDMLSDIAMTL